MQTVVSVAHTNLDVDARVQRQLKALSICFNVVCISDGSTKTGWAELRRVPITSDQHEPLGTRRARKCRRILFNWLGLHVKNCSQIPWVRQCVKELSKFDWSICIANDILSLVAASQFPNRQIVFDAHEFYPRFKSLTHRSAGEKAAAAILHNCLPGVRGISTVSPGLQKLYHDDFGVTPALIRNCPPWHDIKPTPTKGKRLRLVHHGLFKQSRGISELVEAVKRLNGQHSLDLYLTGNQSTECFRRLRKEVDSVPYIRVMDPVPVPSLITTLNQYDVGVFLLPCTNDNHRYALPNKLFDFIQARLAVAVSPNQDMASLVKTTDTGVIIPGWNTTALAECLSGLTTESVSKFKASSGKAARQLCSENELSNFVSFVSQCCTSRIT